MPLEPLPERSQGMPPRPKPFHMTEPAFQNGLWVFWLTADDNVIQFVNALNCVLPFANSPFFRRAGARILVSINPRYDHREAWAFIQEVLQGETELVDLGESWEQAINGACQHEDEL
ncbi:MAG: hypothetical protein LCI00_20090 [Chloroflexi bacterium]|nr:hypothetical protein [Chloroflexota bacterium]MCC6893780.1 hypothetical protein [Anaerolineae bacterium]